MLGLARSTPATTVTAPCGTAWERVGAAVSTGLVTVTVSVVCPMSAQSASATRSKVYEPSVVPVGTVTLTVNAWLLGLVTPVRVDGVNVTHDAAAGAGAGAGVVETSIWRSVTGAANELLINVTIWVPSSVPPSTPSPPGVRAAMAS